MEDGKDSLSIDKRTKLCNGCSVYEINIAKVHELYLGGKLKPYRYPLFGVPNLAKGNIIVNETNITAGPNSERGSKTHNAYTLNPSKSDSSIGSTAGVSANLAMASIGTETNGLIVVSPSLSATFGFKSTI
ncbi:hypothetical protein K502DRAFT_353271 [Neoconidiobolus thromboides FSU 785]|nr:hypothetical protein K502DRAFT_353271 [Neoconidiobolus thromboides FSU 785]